MKSNSVPKGGSCPAGDYFDLHSNQYCQRHSHQLSAASGVSCCYKSLLPVSLAAGCALLMTMDYGPVGRGLMFFGGFFMEYIIM